MKLRTSGAASVFLSTVFLTALLTACGSPDGDASPTSTDGETDVLVEPGGDGLEAEGIEVEGIPAGLETEQLAIEFMDRSSIWANFGFTEETIQAWLAYPGETGDFTTDVARENEGLFADILFIDDWEGDEHLTRTAEWFSSRNSAILERALKTFDKTYDEEPYRIWFEVSASREISNDGTVRVIEVDFTNFGNSDKNRVGEDFGLDSASQEGNMSTWTLTFETRDGFSKLVSLDARDLR